MAELSKKAEGWDDVSLMHSLYFHTNKRICRTKN
jgi:hypothetical protein